MLIDPLVRWNQSLGFPEYSIDRSTTPPTIRNSKPFVPENLEISDVVFKKFYEYHDALREIAHNSDNDDLDGNYMRMPETALKIAALFASFDGSDAIEIKHYAKAMQITEKQRRNLHEFHQQVAVAIPKKTNKERVLGAILKKGSPMRRTIEQATHIKVDMLKNILDELIQDGLVREVSNNGKSPRYELMGDYVYKEPIDRRSVEV